MIKNVMYSRLNRRRPKWTGILLMVCWQSVMKLLNTEFAWDTFSLSHANKVSAVPRSTDKKRRESISKMKNGKGVRQQV